MARHASVKIVAGSALDRLTQGQSFTEVVHQIAEMYWNAGGRPAQEIEGQSRVVEPAAPERQSPAPDEVKPISFGGNSREAHREPEEHQRPVQGQKLFSVPDPETGVYVTVNETEALRLLKQQCPAGLEPVLDEFMIVAENAGQLDNEEVVQPSEPEFDYATLA